MQVGDRIGAYRLVRLLGRGGMGTVYEAAEEALGRRVAIKILNRDLCGIPEWRARFLNEARTANSVGHTGIVAVHETGELADGGAYMVMELLRGETLNAKLARERVLSVAAVTRIAKQTASALAAAHAAGIIHRDLKPENIFLLEDPEIPGGFRVKLLDFGIAKRRTDGSSTAISTRRGIGMGTPGYLAPEQIYAAEEVDDRADVYSLGVVLYEALSGARPFVRERSEDELRAQLLCSPLPLRDFAPEAPGRLIELIEEMLSQKPADRPSMASIGAELRTWGSEPALQPSSPDGPFPRSPTARGRRRLRGRLLAASFFLSAVALFVLRGSGNKIRAVPATAPAELPRIAALTQEDEPRHRPPASPLPEQKAELPSAQAPTQALPAAPPRIVPVRSPDAKRRLVRPNEGTLTHEDIRKLY